jgi:hypothetical protein
LKDLVDITILLDRSGSMQIIENETVGSYNNFLKEQQEHPGEAKLSLIQFDDKYEVNYLDKPLKEALV